MFVRSVVMTLGMLLLAGCSGGGPTLHKVTGTLTRDGVPLTISLPAGSPPGDPGIQMGLIASEADKKDGTSYAAVVDTAKATFTVNGPNNQGIPPGKYKVYVQVGVAGMVAEDKNPLSRSKTPLTVEVPGSGDINVEVGKTPAVSRK